MLVTSQCPKMVYADADDIIGILWTYYVEWDAAPMSLFNGINMNCRVEMCLMSGDWKEAD